MRKLKLMTLVGTRPELIKMSEIIKKCNIYFDHTLVHTGQNYDFNLNEIFFIDLGLPKPKYYLDVVGENLGQTIGNVISKSYELMEKCKPDAILVLGDTNSGLCVISAKRLKIPTFHLEAGNRCFDENLPEEINRRIIDHTSDVNMCYTEHARRYLYNEGIPKERSFVVGSPMKEVIEVNIQKINESDILQELQLQKRKYILLSVHREENIDDHNNFLSLMSSINNISEFYDMPVIYSMHPRSRAMINRREFILHRNIRSLPPFSFTAYIKLQQYAFCVISDSGTLAEESSYFKFPAVSLRTSTERPEAIDKGSMIIGGIGNSSVMQSVELAVNLNKDHYVGSNVPDYDDNNVSVKVLKIIQSYTQIVNRDVWRK